MAIITVICPVCGSSAQIEAGTTIRCPYCTTELNELSSAQNAPNTAFAQQDMQFAQNVQFAPPQQQMQPQVQVQPAAAVPLPQAQPYMPQQNAAGYLYSPAQIAEAHNKRKNWYMVNSAMVAAQSFMLAFGILFAVKGYRFGVPLILTWVLTLAGFGAFAGLTRPDEAYIDKKPFNKTKFGAGITQLWLSAAISGAVGGILFAILAGLFGMY